MYQLVLENELSIFHVISTSSLDWKGEIFLS